MKKLKKMCITMMTVIMMSIILAVTALAAPMNGREAAEALTAQSDQLYVKGALWSRTMDRDTFWEIMDFGINSVFRSSDPCSLGACNYWPSDAARNMREYEVSYHQLEQMAWEQDYVDVWCLSNVPGIVSNGTDKETAIRAAYDWVLDFAEIGWDLLQDPTIQNANQSAYSLLTTRRGICSSYSKLFRSIVEAIPFDETGLVDWQNGSDYISVALVDYLPKSSNGHEWAAIQGESGEWKHYDLFSADSTQDAQWREVCYAQTEQFILEKNNNLADSSQWTWFY